MQIDDERSETAEGVQNTSIVNVAEVPILIVKRACCCSLSQCLGRRKCCAGLCRSCVSAQRNEAEWSSNLVQRHHAGSCSAQEPPVPAPGCLLVLSLSRQQSHLVGLASDPPWLCSGSHHVARRQPTLCLHHHLGS